ncbi:MAG: DciA family protein [Rhodanobacteraceae bacterium]
MRHLSRRFARRRSASHASTRAHPRELATSIMPISPILRHRHRLSPARPLPPRDTHGPTPLAQCAPVADLAARAREMDHVSQRIVPLLPVPLRDHVRHAGLRNDRVLLLVESSAWATRARMDQTRILAAVQSLGLAATSVTAKVVPVDVPDSDGTVVPRPPRDAAQHIRAAALAISDPDLHALFMELAALAENPPAK